LVEEDQETSCSEAVTEEGEGSTVLEFIGQVSGEEATDRGGYKDGDGEGLDVAG
jgi:hypothetical protein